MKKLDKRGFSAVEGLLVLVIVAILGFVGWYVWKQHNDNKTAPSVSTTPQATTTTPKTTTKPAALDPYAGWKTYTNSSYGVSFKYPSNWNVDVSTISGDLYIAVSQITPAQIAANRSSLSKYNNYMQVSFGVSKTNIGGGGSWGGNVLEYLTFNEVKYPLIGSKYKDKVAQVLLMKCASKSDCTDWVPTSKGGSIDARITSVTNQQAATIPMDLNSSQYKTAHLILKSLKI